MTRRYAANVDANQKAIVTNLRKIGVSVQHLHDVGKGVPDLLCGYQGTNVLMEIKDGSKVPSARKLRPDQIKWHDKWRGQVCVVNNLDEALEALGIELRGTVG